MWKLHTSLYDEATGAIAGGDTNTANIAPSFNPFEGTPSPTEHGGPQTDAKIPAAPPVVQTPVTTPTPQNPTGNRQQQTQVVKPVAPVVQPAAPVVQPTTVPGAVAMTPEQLRTLAESMRAPAPVVQPAAQPQMTEAEFKKQFNVVEVTPDDYQALLGVAPQTPQQVEKLNHLLQATARQAVTVNRALTDDAINRLRAEFQSQLGPVTQDRAAQQEATIERNFLNAYPGLSDYRPLLREIATAAQARGMSFQTEAEMHQFAAAQAGKLLGRDPATFKVASVQVQGGQPQTTQTRTAQPSGARTMSTTSMGGRSGQTGGAAPAQSTAERIFAGSS